MEHIYSAGNIRGAPARALLLPSPGVDFYEDVKKGCAPDLPLYRVPSRFHVIMRLLLNGYVYSSNRHGRRYPRDIRYFYHPVPVGIAVRCVVDFARQPKPTKESSRVCTGIHTLR